MAKRNSAGGSFIRRERNNNREKEAVITNSIKYESKLTQLKSGAVKRVRK